VAGQTLARDWKMIARRAVPLTVLIVALAYAFIAQTRKDADREAWEAVAVAATQRAAVPFTPLPLGESFDGAPLTKTDARHPAKQTPLDLRRACAWGEPGRDPYKGTVTQALTAARMPEALARKFRTLIDMKMVNARVEITREGISSVASGRAIPHKSMDMAFGNTMCFNTRVNFKPGHVELADLYQVVDENGKTHTVMVPDVCGNVTVLGDRDDRDNRTDGDVLADRFERAPSVPTKPGEVVVPRESLVVRKEIIPRIEIAAVPEPGTIVLFGAGVAGLAWLAGRRRREGRT
jgi:hypothetical protein